MNLYDYKVSDIVPGSPNEIECLICEIDSQIEGNSFLKNLLVDEQQKLKSFISNPGDISEANKRGLVILLREKLKSIDIATYNELVKGEND